MASWEWVRRGFWKGVGYILLGLRFGFATTVAAPCGTPNVGWFARRMCIYFRNLRYGPDLRVVSQGVPTQKRSHTPLLAFPAVLFHFRC